MQFRDLKKQYDVLKPEIDAGIQSVLDSSSFILGKQVVELEEKLAKYVGRKHCIPKARRSKETDYHRRYSGIRRRTWQRRKHRLNFKEKRMKHSAALSR